MPVQIIIFLTKNKIFACEIGNNGQTDDISINGKPEAQLEGKENIDVLVEGIYDAFGVDHFSDDHFDIVIVDCGSDKNLVLYAAENCLDANKLSIISLEKILPLIVCNKMQVQAGQEIVVAFAESCYKVVCDESNVIKCVGKARKGKQNITLAMDDFSCLYYFKLGKTQGCAKDAEDLLKKEAAIEKLRKEKEEITDSLKEKETMLTALQKRMQETEEEINRFTEEKNKWEQEQPRQTDYAEQMIKVLEECQADTDDLGGELYIRGAIPKKKLNATIKNFSEKLAHSEYDFELNGDCVLAVYYNHHADKKLNSLLFTEEFFCYDFNYNTNDIKLVKWDTVKNVESDDYYDSIHFTFINGKEHYMSMDDEDIRDDFFVPLFNKMRKIDCFE